MRVELTTVATVASVTRGPTPTTEASLLPALAALIRSYCTDWGLDCCLDKAASIDPGADPDGVWPKWHKRACSYRNPEPKMRTGVPPEAGPKLGSRRSMMAGSTKVTLAPDASSPKPLL